MTDSLFPTLYAGPNKTTDNNVSVLLGSVFFKQVRQLPGTGTYANICYIADVAG